MTTADIARVCHEANRGLQILAGGEEVVAPWDQAPSWMQASAIRGVENALEGAGPREMHRSWMADRLSAGWVYGPVKDAEAMTHPCLVPYDELPPAQRRKDVVFLAIVGALKGEL